MKLQALFYLFVNVNVLFLWWSILKFSVRYFQLTSQANTLTVFYNKTGVHELSTCFFQTYFWGKVLFLCNLCLFVRANQSVETWHYSEVSVWTSLRRGFLLSTKTACRDWSTPKLSRTCILWSKRLLQGKNWTNFNNLWRDRGLVTLWKCLPCLTRFQIYQ